MLTKTFRLFLSAAAVFLLVSCNLYAPFTTENNANDYLEVAEKCLKNNDVGCAIQNYQMLPDGDLKNQKLCISYLSLAGFTAQIMVNTVAQNNSFVVGNLADQLSPWSSDQTSNSTTAQPYCNAVLGQAGILLQVLSLFVDCSLRIAKSTQIWGSSPSDTTCTMTNPNGNSAVMKNDIGDNNAGMCSTDVLACQNDFVTMATLDLNGNGLSNFAQALSSVPKSLKTPSDGILLGREAIQSALAN